MRLEGLVYRALNPGWAWAPESGEGAALRGGRFNRKGVPALYTSRRLETAVREAQQGWPGKLQPMTLCSYQVDCEDLADLTDAGIRAGLGVVPDLLASPWEFLFHTGTEPPTWMLADRLIRSGFAGILVPSFAPGAVGDDVNVVFWTWGSARPHRVVGVDELRRLPRSRDSWKS